MKKRLQAQKKLMECEFFLKKLRFVKEGDLEWDCYYMAFLVAWRSVMDVLLYDAAFRFNLGFTLDDHLRDWKFVWAAKKDKKERALDFLRWWSRACSSLEEFPLWKKRDVFLHRGYPEKGPIYVPHSTSSGTMTLSSGYISEGDIIFYTDNGIFRPTPESGMYTNDYQEALAGYTKMKKIVKEAIELLK